MNHLDGEFDAQYRRAGQERSRSVRFAQNAPSHRDKYIALILHKSVYPEQDHVHTCEKPLLTKKSSPLTVQIPNYQISQCAELF